MPDTRVTQRTKRFQSPLMLLRQCFDIQSKSSFFPYFMVFLLKREFPRVNRCVIVITMGQVGGDLR